MGKLSSTYVKAGGTGSNHCAVQSEGHKQVSAILRSLDNQFNLKTLK
jgi:hypothetical protein